MRLPQSNPAELPESGPCTALAACHALYTLGLDDARVEVGWRKLAGRPVGKVRELLKELEGERPELIMHRLTQFAKEHKAERRRG